MPQKGISEEIKGAIYKHWRNTGLSNKELGIMFGGIADYTISKIITEYAKKKESTRVQVDYELQCITSLECQKGKDTKGTPEEEELNKKIGVHMNRIKELDHKFYVDSIEPNNI